jgi:hypothetical protein
MIMAPIASPSRSRQKKKNHGVVRALFQAMKKTEGLFLARTL